MVCKKRGRAIWLSRRRFFGDALVGAVKKCPSQGFELVASFWLCRLLTGPNPKHFCRSWKALIKSRGLSCAMNPLWVATDAPWITFRTRPKQSSTKVQKYGATSWDSGNFDVEIQQLWFWAVGYSWLFGCPWLPLAAHVQEMSVQSYANCSGQFGIRFERSEALRFEKHEPFIAYSHWTYS